MQFYFVTSRTATTIIVVTNSTIIVITSTTIIVKVRLRRTYIPSGGATPIGGKFMVGNLRISVISGVKGRY